MKNYSIPTCAGYGFSLAACAGTYRPDVPAPRVNT